MINTHTRTLNLLTELQKTIPDFNVKYKNQSLFIKIIGFILFFNKQFMTDYITTIGSTVYFPTIDFFEKDPVLSQEILTHEFVHALDRKHNSFFQFLYLFPQILAPIFIILFFFLPSLVNLSSLVIAIICLLPIIPAYWRSNYELRGYQMSLFSDSELMKELGVSTDQYNLTLSNNVKFINEQFISSDYYWMNRSGVQNQLLLTVNKIKNDSIINDDPSYSIVRLALKNSLIKAVNG